MFEKLPGGHCCCNRVIKRERLGCEGREGTKGEDFALILSETGVRDGCHLSVNRFSLSAAT